MEKPLGKIPLGRFRRKLKDNTKLDVRKMCCDTKKWI
jgi:hypothetical protein